MPTTSVITPAVRSATVQTAAHLDTATYTVSDLARLLQCSERHIWRLIDMGNIPGVLRIGRLVRVSRKIADAWIAGEKGGDR